MKFGILKSKIEKRLSESYSNNTFQKELKTFKKLVLENSNISKIYYLYDQLTSNQGLNESVLDDYIDECVKIYESTISKIKTQSLDKIKSWVKNVNSGNEYNHIDNLFSKNVLTIESKINGKKIIKECLKKKPLEKKESINIPLSSMINVANNTIKNYIENLSESEKKELTNFLNIDDETLKPKFETVKENLISKLTLIKESEKDSEVLSKINETIEKVNLEKYNKLNYFRLEDLNNNL
jgi:hypothetical protein